ncbi:MAG: putative S-adenosylmethionine-dependent methyltransferase [Hyphomicrobiales bacterium]|nr:putative S-adenosylmethionine-dependent methyltransferase [Hyphomicrobiales bacterium]
MNAILKQLSLDGMARSWRERHALMSALAEAQNASASLEPIKKALELVTQRQPTDAELGAWSAIERRRDEMLSRHDIVQHVDFGAGTRDHIRSADEQRNGGMHRVASVKDLTEPSSHPMWGEFLYYVTRISRPNKVLELGSCVGISAGYITAGLKLNNGGHLWTLEGSPASAELAQQTLDGLYQTPQGTIVVGRFDDTLQDCLDSHGPFDLAFIDGHHDGEATMHYYAQIKRHLAPDAILIFDDVHYSPSMELAWQTIASDPAAHGQLRIRARGVVVI